MRRSQAVHVQKKKRKARPWGITKQVLWLCLSFSALYYRLTLVRPTRRGPAGRTACRVSPPSQARPVHERAAVSALRHGPGVVREKGRARILAHGAGARGRASAAAALLHYFAGGKGGAYVSRCRRRRRRDCKQLIIHPLPCESMASTKAVNLSVSRSPRSCSRSSSDRRRCEAGAAGQGDGVPFSWAAAGSL